MYFNFKYHGLSLIAVGSTFTLHGYFIFDLFITLTVKFLSNYVMIIAVNVMN